MLALSNASSQPRRMRRPIIQSVRTTRSQSVGLPAVSGADRFEAKNSSLALTASMYVTVTPDSPSNFLIVG